MSTRLLDAVRRRAGNDYRDVPEVIRYYDWIPVSQREGDIAIVCLREKAGAVWHPSWAEAAAPSDATCIAIRPEVRITVAEFGYWIGWHPKHRIAVAWIMD